MRVNKIHPKSDNTLIANFIQDTFHRRECVRFSEADSGFRCCCDRTRNNNAPQEGPTPDASAAYVHSAESICTCGYVKTTHSKEAVGYALSSNSSRSWNVEEDTDTFPTNAHGKIEFDETEAHIPLNKPTIKRFIRLDYKVDLDKVLELFRDYWKMDQPQLFLSIISNETRRKQDPEESDETQTRREAIEKFCDKLVEAAIQTNAWIITTGVMEGIGGIVGDKIEKCVDEKGKRPKAVLSICNWGCVRDKHRLIHDNRRNNNIATHSICSKCGGKTSAHEVSLDRNHSAFVLVDDGRQFQPGCERSVRQNLELKLRKSRWTDKDEKSSNDDPIPFIYFLIGGNASDIQHVERALANEIPVIIAKGTGGAADLIADIVNTSEDDKTCTGVETARIKEVLGLSEDSKDLDRIRCNLCLIQNLRGRLVLFFDTMEENSGSQDLSLRVLEALRASMNNPTNIFVLAADWDQKIFFKDLLREKPEGSDLDDVMHNLLLKDNHSYVEFLLGNGVNLVEVTKKIWDFKLTDLTEIEIVSHLKDQTIARHQQFPQHQAELEHKIGKLLCLWSAYKGMREMAKVFWRLGKDYLAMALLAYKVSKEKKKKLRGTDKREPMREQMKMFANLAMSFLLKCDTDNPDKTITLLRGQVRDLKGQTPMQIALEADFKEFVAQPSFQEILNQFWSKRIIDHSKHKYLALSVAILCPFAAPNLFQYRDDEAYTEDLDEHSPTMRSFLYFFRKVRSFLDAPVIKFIYHALSYLAYLVLFSIVMLTDFRTTMSPSEIALTIWTFILIIEECRQVASFRREYLDKWNILDVSALTLYVIGFILRIVHQSLPSVCPECLYVARIVLSFSLLIAILRVLQLLSINPILGPKIYMIGRLLRDMISFMLILTVFISAYGVVSNVILYPNQPLNATLLQDVFYDAWWSVIQQFNREDALGLNCNMDDPSPNVSLEYCSSPTDLGIDYEMCKKHKCPANTWLVSVLLAFYALLTCIMMLNVLIAMFNVSFTKVEEKQHIVSKMQRYRLIREYNFRPMLPAPLCVFAYLKYVPRLWTLCKYCCFTDDDFDEAMDFNQLESSKIIFSEPLVPAITMWEESMREKYEEAIKVRQMIEIAEVEQRENMYRLVLRNPNYITSVMQASMTQMEKRLLEHVRKDIKGATADATKDLDASTDIAGEGKEPGDVTIIPGRPKPEPKRSSPPQSSVPGPMPGPKPTDKSDESSSRQDTSTKPPRKLRTRDPKVHAIRPYPDIYRRPKTICTNPNCKMIVRCRNGSTIEFKQPFSKPIDWSKITVKKAHITRIHFKCENCEKAGRVMNSASTLREILDSSTSTD